MEFVKRRNCDKVDRTLGQSHKSELGAAEYYGCIMIHSFHEKVTQ